jgi:phosphoserine phosphatase RsbU/P
LFELGKEFNTLLDPDKVVRLLVFSLLGQIGVNRYLVCLKQEADMRVAASKIDAPVPQPEFLRILTSVKKASRVGDIVVRHAEDPRPALSAMGITVIIPMRMQEETKGIVFVGDKLSKEPFTEADLEFLAALANLAIISLENARLFKEAIEKQKLEDELLIAREIQKGLLPSSLPSIPGFEIAAANISSKQVGGDYYDVIALQDGKYVIAIGDVSGKGSPAALLMANLQATIRALVPLHLTLGELTHRVNDLMCSNTGGSKFVTFFWGVLDPATRTLRYVNAGHNYPYVIREDGSLKRLEKGGMILGIMPAVVPYEEGTVTFSTREFLVLFTDGVSEAMSKEGEEYGEERLETSLLRNRTGGAQDLLSAIHQDILQFTQGASQSDDITMMIIKIT